MRLPDPQRSRAVLIGTSKYADERLPDLPVVSRTIGDLSAALTDPVYGVVPQDHCTVLEDQGDIRLIGRQLRLAATYAEDLLLVYFVGHGLLGPRRHELYLGLPDSDLAEPEFNSLEYDKLRSAVLDSRAATKVIILDCCFSGRAATHAMADPVGEIVGQLEVDGTYVLASAGRDQVSLIMPGEERTAFTGRFLQLLSNGVPGGPGLLTLDYLYLQLVTRMNAEGLPQPRRIGTSTAELLALAANRALEATRQLAPKATNAPRVVGATDPAASASQLVELPVSSNRAVQSSMPTELAKTTDRLNSEAERRFHRAMISIYETAKRELGYNATRFIQMVSQQGGLATARQLLWSDKPSEGFTTLWSHHRPDLTVEAHVLRDEFAELFTDDDRDRARDRLGLYGWRDDRSLTPPRSASHEPDEPGSSELDAPGAKRTDRSIPSGAAPIKPVSGRQWTVGDISGRAIIATRETVSGKPDPAVRIFTGDTAGKEVGDRFDSHHRMNHMPCGVWTVIAVAEAGRLTSGQLPAGTRKLRVNELG